MPNPDFTQTYQLIRTTLKQSKSSFEAKRFSMILEAIATVSNNGASQLASLYATYKHNSSSNPNGSTDLDVDTMQIYPANAALAAIGTASLAVSSIANVVAYHKGPDGLTTQYLNSMIVSNQLDLEKVQNSINTVASIDQDTEKFHTDLQKSQNDAKSSATKAQKSKDLANIGATDAKNAAAKAEESSKKAAEIVLELKELLTKEQEKVKEKPKKN